jgi:hypothetical protein
MKSASILLLGSALALLCGCVASAEESPFRKAAQGRYEDGNNICAARHGPGFVYVPAFNSCVRVGGSVQMDYRMTR